MKFAFMMLGEYADVFVVSALAVTVFLGGWYSGIPIVDRFVPAPLIFVGKSLFLVFVQMFSVGGMAISAPRVLDGDTWAFSVSAIAWCSQWLRGAQIRSVRLTPLASLAARAP